MEKPFDNNTIYSWIKANPIYFKKLVALYYPLDFDLIALFEEEEYWFLSNDISFNSIYPYYDCKHYLYSRVSEYTHVNYFIGRRSYPHSKIYKNKYNWYWDLISTNQNIVWSFDLIKAFSNKWKYPILENESIPWHLEMVDYFHQLFDIKSALTYNSFDWFSFNMANNATIANIPSIINKYPNISKVHKLKKFEDDYIITEFFFQIYRKYFKLQYGIFHSIKKNEWSLNLIKNLNSENQFHMYFENDRIFMTLLNEGLINKEIVNSIISTKPIIFDYKNYDPFSILTFGLEKNYIWHTIVYALECKIHLKHEDVFCFLRELIENNPKLILHVLFSIDQKVSLSELNNDRFYFDFPDFSIYSLRSIEPHFDFPFDHYYEVFNFKLKNYKIDDGRTNMLFGKHRGVMTISEIFYAEPEYVEWLLLNTDYTIDEYLLLNKFPYINNYRFTDTAVFYNHMKVKYIESFLSCHEHSLDRNGTPYSVGTNFPIDNDILDY
jgi:hypothetical protein